MIVVMISSNNNRQKIIIIIINRQEFSDLCNEQEYKIQMNAHTTQQLRQPTNIVVEIQSINQSIKNNFNTGLRPPLN
jgi:hypothetical protein